MSDALWGRDHELAVLREAMTSASRGSGRVVVVAGAAGIGKSALVERWASTIERGAARIVRGRAWEFADAPPYFPVAAALRQLGVDAASPPSPFALWEAVLDALAQATTPTVWILEDLHAADLQTLDLLVFLAQPLRSLAVLVVVTRRNADPRTDPRAAQRIDRLAREGHALTLAPLAGADVTALAERWLGRPLGAAESRAFVERTEGNPLFVVEMARAAQTRGGEGDAVPKAIRELVQERAAALPVATRRALEAGAILGREFAAGHVGRMLDALPARVIDDLASAVGAGLVVERRPGVFAFGHILERDAIEASLRATERVELHARAAAALAGAGDATDVLIERARHAIEGVRPGEEAATIALVERAIDVLETARAYDRAFALAERLESARRTTLVGFPSTPDELPRAASLAHRAGRDAEWRALCETVRAMTRTQERAATFARATLLLGAELSPGFVNRVLVAMIDEALALLDEREPALACLLGARRAAALQPAADPMTIVAIAEDVISRARALDDDEVMLQVLMSAGAALVDYAPIERRIACWLELRERASRAGDVPKLIRAQARLAMDVLQHGDFAAFDAGVDELLQTSLDYGHPRYRWQPLLFASMRACMHGRFDESERHLVEIERLAALTDDPALSLCVGAHRAMRARDVEDEAGLRRAAEEITATVVHLPGAGWVASVLRAAIFAWAGDRDAVAIELVRAEPMLATIAADSTFRSLMVEPVVLAGSRALRESVRAMVEPYAAEEGPLGHVPVWYAGPVVRMLGLLDRSLGDHARGTERLRAALGRARAHDLGPWVQRIERELGETPSVLSPAPVAHGRLGEVRLVREGDAWRLHEGGRTIVVRDVRGMRLLARLVERANEEIHVLVLASDERGSLAETDAGPKLDEKAIKAYRARLSDLVEQLDDAEAMADLGRATRLAAERAALEAELAIAVGLGGKARKAGSATERARVNVQRRLRDAIARIADVDESIGESIGRAVRTGTYCCFRP